MANNRVEIHDPFSNHSDLTSSTNCDTKATSDTDSMTDTMEYRLLMAYAKRRRPKKDIESPPRDVPVIPNGGTHANGPSSPPAPANVDKEIKEKRKRHKKGWKRLPSILRCIKPRTEGEELPQTAVSKPDVNDRSADFRGGECFDMASDNSSTFRSPVSEELGM